MNLPPTIIPKISINFKSNLDNQMNREIGRGEDIVRWPVSIVCHSVSSPPSPRLMCKINGSCVISLLVLVFSDAYDGFYFYITYILYVHIQIYIYIL